MSVSIRSLLLLSIPILIFIGCTSIDHVQLAQKYKIDLRYYENSVKFSDLNMNTEAELSCMQTSILRSECFTSLAQSRMLKNIPLSQGICDEIHPEEKMNMTYKAFKMVYPSIDAALEKELREKLKPSEQRIKVLNQIKQDCYSNTQNG